MQTNRGFENVDVELWRLQGPVFGTSASVYNKKEVIATARGPTFAAESKDVSILLLVGMVFRASLEEHNDQEHTSMFCASMQLLWWALLWTFQLLGLHTCMLHACICSSATPVGQHPAPCRYGL